ncbi:MAG: MBOAT family protein [Oligoflexia bacterium]|nr:MBOAT family protein [Oligoflexia bacterium]
MLFNSISYFIFFPIVVILYFHLQHKYRCSLLLIAGCIFYMWFLPKYILILALLIAIDFFAALLIERSDKNRKKIYLTISITSTCLVLFVFKYFNFFSSNITALAQFLNLKYSAHIFEIALPVGLSFHTFQSLAYVIEVYRGKQKAEKNFSIYALYVLFFPQLVAGPIERPYNLLPQLKKEQRFSIANFFMGLEFIIKGLLKKVVIADHVAEIVNQVYGDPFSYTGTPLIIATVLFSIQIYCDFSGYTDIAIGSAKILGIDLMKNFNHPYLAMGIADFWKRWHISLSSWFRDYLYIPLGGSRVDKLSRLYLNIFIVFTVSGLWHGAKWTFIIWGILHGIYWIIEDYGKRLFSGNHLASSIFKLHIIKISSIGVTFSLVCFSWIFFRANGLSDAIHIATNLFNFSAGFNFSLSTFKFGFIEFNTILIILALTLLKYFLQECFPTRISNLKNNISFVRVYYSFQLSLVCLFWVRNSESFIYFQF